MRAPAVIRWPGHIKPGTIFNDMFASYDWMPTFVEIAGGAKGNDLNAQIMAGKYPGIVKTKLQGVTGVHPAQQRLMQLDGGAEAPQPPEAEGGAAGGGGGARRGVPAVVAVLALTPLLLAASLGEAALVRLGEWTGWPLDAAEMDRYAEALARREQALDEVARRRLAAIFPGPATFTGEDVLEVEVPGHPTLVQVINDALVEHFDHLPSGARPAGPGEFSARAFLAGRLSPGQASGIADLIAAVKGFNAKRDQLLSPVVAERTTGPCGFL